MNRRIRIPEDILLHVPRTRGDQPVFHSCPGAPRSSVPRKCGDEPVKKGDLRDLLLEEDVLLLGDGA
jgi:hypothetical protein